MVDIRIQQFPPTTAGATKVIAVEDQIGGLTESVPLQEVANLAPKVTGGVVQRVRVKGMVNEVTNLTNDTETTLFAEMIPLNVNNKLDISVVFTSEMVNLSGLPVDVMVGNCSLFRSTQTVATLCSTSVGRGNNGVSSTKPTNFFGSNNLTFTETAITTDLHRYVLRYRVSSLNTTLRLQNANFNNAYMIIEEREP